MTRLRVLAPLTLATVLLTSCSAGGGSGAAPTTTAPAPAATGPALETRGEGPGGGVNGLIAYVSGQLMQVQGDDMQTAVTWDADTTITAEVAAAAADVVPGVCVAATTEGSPDEARAATSVTVTQPVDGECTPGGFAGGPPAGGRLEGMPADKPSDLPGGGTQVMPGGPMPSGAPGEWAQAVAMRTVGLVTAVDGGTITVETTTPDGTTSTSEVTVDDSTTYTTTVAADASAIVVGQCAEVRGEADSSGAVAATSLAVSAPTDGTCSSFSMRSGSMRSAGDA